MNHIVAGLAMGALYGLLLVWVYFMVTTLVGIAPPTDLPCFEPDGPIATWE